MTKKSINHRGKEVLLDKPPNESAMTEEQKREWYRARHEPEPEPVKKEKV